MNTQIIAIANQKGGVGKTTTCANLGIGLAQAGKKVLLIDGDPQGSLTISLGYPQPDKLPFTLSDAMGRILMDEPLRPGEGILHHPEGVDLMPADIQLSGMEVSLVNAMSRETILRQYLDTVKGQYSHILIDCQPSLGMLTVNALAAANRVIIPVQAEYLPAKGLEQLLQTVNKVKRQINPKLQIDGILLTMVDNRTNFAKEIAALLRETYGSKIKVFATEKKVELASVDDLFTTEQERQEADEERVVRIPLTQLHYFKGYPAMQTEVPFTGQPYRFKDDDPKMQETLDSVKKRGVRAPGLVRPDPDGGYEIISGHRRHRASELAGLEDMPVIIRDMTDEEAVIEMVDANIQREKVMPSEKAWAYRMKLEAIKHQGARTDLTSVQVEQKLSARDKVAKDAGEKSGIQIMRYIRLTELIPELLDMVDEKKIAFNPAYELSFLKKEEQIQLLDAMDSEQATPSLSQAQRLKKFSQEGRLSIDVMRAIMGEEKKSDLDKVTFTSDTLRKYFPKSYTPARMQETIIKLLEQWQKKRQRDQER